MPSTATARPVTPARTGTADRPGAEEVAINAVVGRHPRPATAKPRTQVEGETHGPPACPTGREGPRLGRPRTLGRRVRFRAHARPQPLQPAAHPAQAARPHLAPQPHVPAAAMSATRHRPAPHRLPDSHHNRSGSAHRGRRHAPTGLPAAGGRHPGPRRRRPAGRHPGNCLPRPELVGRRGHPRQHLPHDPRLQRLGPALGFPRRALHPARRTEELGGARTLPSRAYGM